MSEKEKKFYEEHAKDVPLRKVQDPLNAGKELPASEKSQGQAFVPAGRTEIPLTPASVGVGAPMRVPYVDTLAIQTKLGAANRALEQSMSLNDSEIVKMVKVTAPAESAFSGAPDIRLVGAVVPRKVALKGVTPAQPVCEQNEWVREQAELAAHAAIVCMTPIPPKEGKHEPIVVEKPEPSKPIIVEPLLPAASLGAMKTGEQEKIRELEAENEALLGIVIRLKAENKVLKVGR